MSTMQRFVGLAALLFSSNLAVADDRPHIVWIVVEDMSSHFGYQGETAIQTPHVDRLAAEGVQFSRAFITAPVCSAARSALITGMYQTSIGAHHHRSGRGKAKIQLPDHVSLIPRLFQEAGYYTTNGDFAQQGDRIAKTDYNFEYDPAIYDANDWLGRSEGQPFFAQIQLNGGKMRGATAQSFENFARRVERELGHVTRPEDVKLPPYYPPDPVILEDWARYLDTVRLTDHQVGQILQRLEDEGIAEKTYVFLITDHGVSHARGKQFCYEEGIHIPFLVRGPGLEAGTIRDDLIVHIDMAATSLKMAGIEVPEAMEGLDLFADNYRPRSFVVSARDRCDETVDRIRSVRTDRYKYIRNFYPERPHLQPNTYKDNKAIYQAIRRLEADGRLDPVPSLITAASRAPEELYDLDSDPHEVRNLADDPVHQPALLYHRGLLEGWIQTSGDRGQWPEPDALYDSDMTAYVDQIRRNDEERAAEIEGNIRQMKQWASEGK